MYIYKCILDRVIDGDTIDAEIDLGFDIKVKKRIRLYGINAPETRTRDLEEKSRGKLAKARLIEILNDSNNIFYLQSTSIGKFGRSIGILYTHLSETNISSSDKQSAYPESINRKLIIEGLAEEYGR